jgi:hypothetical protein
MTTTKQPQPPAGLKTRGRSLWRSIMAVYQLDPAETELLHELCRNLDEIDALVAALADQPVVVEGSQGQPRPNPLLAELRAHRTLSERLAAALALPVGGEVVGRRRSSSAKAAVNTRWRRVRAAEARTGSA